MGRFGIGGNAYADFFYIKKFPGIMPGWNVVLKLSGLFGIFVLQCENLFFGETSG